MNVFVLAVAPFLKKNIAGNVWCFAKAGLLTTKFN